VSSGERSAVAALIEFLVARPEAIDKLLADHIDDGRGDCRKCSIGAQGGHHTWPCSLHAAATAAEARRR
jgi:hypothetical protein